MSKRARYLIALAAIILCVLVGLLIVRREPWMLDFRRGGPHIEIRISNTTAGVAGVTIKTSVAVPSGFEERSVKVTSAHQELPIGKVTFFDGTVMPGRLTVLVDSHSIDIMPGGLTIDGRRYEWEKIQGMTLPL